MSAEWRIKRSNKGEVDIGVQDKTATALGSYTRVKRDSVPLMVRFEVLPGCVFESDGSIALRAAQSSFKCGDKRQYNVRIRICAHAHLGKKSVVSRLNDHRLPPRDQLSQSTRMHSRALPLSHASNAVGDSCAAGHTNPMRDYGEF